MVNDYLNNKTLNGIMENKFTFEKYFSNVNYNTPIEINPMNFEVKAFDDIEWTNVLNRMEYCCELCHFSEKTNDSKYAKKSKELIFDFINLYNNKKSHPNIRTLDTAIRLIKWDVCITYFLEKKMITSTEYTKVVKSIKWQMEYLVDEFEEFQRLSNWGLVQSIAYLNCIKYTNFTEQFNEFYIEIFNQHLKTQFFQDGVQWEQSIGYQCDVVERLLELNNLEYINDNYTALLKNVLYALNAFTNIDGSSILLGDGDEIDLTAIKQKISIVIGDLTLSDFSKQYESVYYQFKNKYVISNYLKKYSDMRKVYNLSEAGYYVIKAVGLYFSLQNGPLGYGHGHLDNLHINLAIDGNKILTDSGRYTYVSTNINRKKYKWFEAHNGISMKDTNITYIDSWTSLGYLDYNPITKIENNESTLLNGVVMYNNMFANRKCLILKDKVFVIMDKATADFEVNYTFYPTCHINKDSENYIKSEDIQLYFENYNSLNIENSFISPKYGVEEKTKKIKIKTCSSNKLISIFASNDVDISAFHDYKYSNESRLSEKEKNFKLYKISIEDIDYVVGINCITSMNNDNSIVINNRTINSSLFVLNMNTEEIENYVK